MIIFIVIFFVIIAILTYLIILGSNKNKTDKELEMEIKEEFEYWKNYEKRRNGKWKTN